MNQNIQSENPKSVFEHNSQAWDKLSSESNQWTVGASPELIQKAREGEIEIVLTPLRLVPADWLGDVAGKKILCLAGGGGQQAPILAAAGGIVTTLDYSQAQLDQDKRIAEREGLEVATVRGLMSDLSMFDNETFDLIVHPCSNSFTPDVKPVWKEAARVLKTGGVLVAGFCNPVIFLFDLEASEKGELVVANKIPYSDVEDLSPAMKQRFIDNGEAFSYSHTLSDQIGGQIEAGFSITGFYEDNWNNSEEPICEFMDPFIATRAVKN